MSAAATNGRHARSGVWQKTIATAYTEPSGRATLRDATALLLSSQPEHPGKPATSPLRADSGPERRKTWHDPGMRSPQTLSEADRRVVAAWAADCAERVLGLFEAQAPGDSRPRDAIARTRAFARGELGVAEEIRRRFENGGAAREVGDPAAAAAARAAGQARAIPHMGAHALSAAAYAAKAAGLATSNRTNAVSDEIRWQLSHISAAVSAALRQLPPVGENQSGPLGRGLLSSGLLGTITRELQAGLTEPSIDREPALDL
jgi:hypothetical protein